MSDFISLSKASRTSQVQSLHQFLSYDDLDKQQLAFADYFLQLGVDDSPKGGAEAYILEMCRLIGSMNEYLSYGILTSLAKASSTACPALYRGENDAREWSSIKNQKDKEELILDRVENRMLLSINVSDVVVLRDGDDFLMTWNSGILRSPGPDKINNRIFPDFTGPADQGYTSDSPLYTKYVDAVNKIFGVDFRRSRTHTRPHFVDLDLGTNLESIFGVSSKGPGQASRMTTKIINWHSKHCYLRLSVKVLQGAVNLNQRVSGAKPPYTEESFIDGAAGTDFRIAHSLRFEIVPVFKIPRSFAVYAAQSDPPRLFNLTQYLREWVVDNITESRYVGVEPAQTLSSIADLSKKKEKLGSYVQPDRANSDGIVASIEGDFRWVPVHTETSGSNVKTYEKTIESLYEYLAEIGAPVNLARSTQDMMLVANTPEMADFLKKNGRKRDQAIENLNILASSPLVTNWDLNVNITVNTVTGGIRVDPIYGASKPTPAGQNHIVGGTAQDGLSQAWKKLHGSNGRGLGSEFDPSLHSPMEDLQAHNMIGRLAAVAVEQGSMKGLAEYLMEARAALKYDPRKALGEANAYRVALAQRSTATAFFDDDMTYISNQDAYSIVQDVAGAAGRAAAQSGLNDMKAGRAPNQEQERWVNLFTRAAAFQYLSKFFLTTVGALNEARHVAGWRREAPEALTEDQILGFWSRQYGDPISSLSDIHKLVVGHAFLAMAKDLMAAINVGKIFDHDVLRGLYDDGAMFVPSIQDVSTQVMPYLYVWTRVIAEAPTIQKEAADRQKALQQARDAKAVPKFALGTDVSFALMQHQARKMGQLSVAPTTDWSDISPGGGKGTITILDAVNLITNHNVKKALVLCPNDLILNYTRDLQKYAKSNWNIIALNTQVFNEWGEERLENLINSSPVNTIVVAGFDWIARAGRTTVRIGSQEVDFYTALEFLRQFPWEAILIDEVHYLRNDSNRNQVVTTLVQDPRVKYVRKLSGTLVVDTVLNVLYEARIDDPGLYGSADDFARRYMPTGALTSESIGQVKRVLEQNASYFRATKKDWAFCLPLPEYEFIPIKLDKKMQDLYTKAVDEVMLNLEIMAKDNPGIRKALEKLANEEQGIVDDSDTESAMALISTQLQSLERLIIDPMGDPIVEQFKGSDFRSPVWDAVIKRLDTHFSTSKNKVIIVCRYKRNAAAILENLGKYKKMGIYYDAGMKENRSRFEEDPDVKILVAVEQSIVNGFNLQMANRIIRIDAPWSPGDLEQAESRIFRPDVENKFGRDRVYIDWIVVDGTLQTAKAARLVSKMVDKAKFDEYGDARYDSIPTLALIKMNLNTFRKSKDLSDYAPYFEAFGTMISIIGQDFMAAKREAEKNPQGFWTPVKGTALPKGSRSIITPLVADGAVPDPFGHSYVAMDKWCYDEHERLIDREYVGTPVRAPMGYGTIADVKYGTDEHGHDYITSVLVRYSTLLDESGKQEEVRMRYTDFNRLFAGTSVNDLGMLLYTVPSQDLVVDSANPQAALATLSKSAGKGKGFNVKGRSSVKPVTPKTEVEELVVPQEPPAAAKTKTEAQKKAKAREAQSAPPETTLPFRLDNDSLALDNTVEAHLVSVNGNPALYFHPEEGDIKALTNLPGFMLTREYMFSECRYEEEFDAQLAYLKKNFEVAKGNLDYLEKFRPLFSGGRNRRFQHSLIGDISDIRDFRIASKKKLSGKQIRVLATVEDQVFYLIVDVTMAPAAKRLRNKVVPGLNARTKWMESDPMLIWMLPSNQPKKVVNTYMNELRKRGLTISNLAELKEQYKTLRMPK